MLNGVRDATLGLQVRSILIRYSLSWTTQESRLALADSAQNSSSRLLYHPSNETRHVRRILRDIRDTGTFIALSEDVTIARSHSWGIRKLVNQHTQCCRPDASVDDIQVPGILLERCVPTRIAHFVLLLARVNPGLPHYHLSACSWIRSNTCHARKINGIIAGIFVYDKQLAHKHRLRWVKG